MTATLGQRIIFTEVLERRSDYTQPQWGTGPSHRKVWKPEPAHVVTGRPSPVSGIIVGIRTLSNGRVFYGDWENGTQYQPDKDGYFTAYLVAYDLRRAPVHVHPDHIFLEDQ